MNPTSSNGNTPQSLIISFLHLRKAVGILGIFLPIGLVTGNFILSRCTGIQDSISDYFYTKMSYLMVSTLCAVALFLYCYKGYEKRDSIASKLACFFALGIAFFPDHGPDANSICNYLHRNDEPWQEVIHYISSAAFFLMLAYFSLFLFTKTSGNPTPRKLMRNRVYKICGFTILGCLVLLSLYFLIPSLRSALDKFKPIIVLETLALFAFGFSWLTKGEAILKDK